MSANEKMAVDSSGRDDLATGRELIKVRSSHFTVDGWRCYSCAGVEYERIARNLDFGVNIYSCLGCGLTQTDYVSNEELLRYYETQYSEHQGRETSGSYSEFSRVRGVAQRKFVETVSGREVFENVLDFGAGAGGGLQAFLPDSQQCVAWDPDPSMRALLASQQNADIVSRNGLFGGRYDEFFDLIVLSHVFEHFVDPRLELAYLNKILKPDGLIYIEVPFESSTVIQQIAAHLKTGVGHIFHFNRRTLRQIIEIDNSFKCIEVDQFGPSVSSYFDDNASLDPTSPSNTDGVWLRTLLKKTATSCLDNIPSRTPDKEYERRRFSSLTEMSAELSEIRRQARSVYALLLDCVERPSEFKTTKQVIKSEGSFDPNFIMLANSVFNEFVKNNNSIGEVTRTLVRDAVEHEQTQFEGKYQKLQQHYIQKIDERSAQVATYDNKVSDLEKSLDLKKLEFDGLQKNHDEVLEQKKIVEACLSDLTEKHSNLTKKNYQLNERHRVVLKQRAIASDKILAKASEIDRLKSTPSFKLGFALMMPLRVLKRAMTRLSGSG